MSVSDQPGGVARGPFSLLSRYGRVIEFLDKFNQVVDRPSFVESAEKVVEMPAEERFTGSYHIYADIFGIDDIESASPKDLPDNLQRIVEEGDSREAFQSLHELLDDGLREIQDEIHHRVLTDRENARQYVIFEVYLDYLRSSLHELNESFQEISKERDNRLLSQLTALNSHLILVAAGEKKEFDEQFLRDILRYAYYDAKRRGEDPDWDPEELTEEEVVGELLIEGSLRAYQRHDISVSRGAELANIPRTEFVNALLERNIQPRYGPQDPDELRSGSGLSKQD